MTEGQLDSHVGKNGRLVWEDINKREKIVQLSLCDVTCPLCFDLGFTDGRLNSGSMFLCSGSVIGFAYSTSLFLTNLR